MNLDVVDERGGFHAELGGVFGDIVGEELFG